MRTAKFDLLAPRFLFVLPLALLVAGCASSGAGRPGSSGRPGLDPGAALPHLVGIAGDHLVALDPESGAITDRARLEGLAGVGALTYDPAAGISYGIADAATAPRLFALDAGEVVAIGTVPLPPGKASFVDALAFDPGSGLLYAAGGNFQFADRLMLVDAGSGKGQEVARIRGTEQNEADALAFAAGVLYAVDAALGESFLYRLDPQSGDATKIGGPYGGEITDLAYDPATGRLLGTVAADRRLVALTLDGELTELGTTHAAGDLEDALLTALAVTTADRGAPELFSDSFESGGLSAWKVKEGGESER